jgi:hypothetical protein
MWEIVDVAGLIACALLAAAVLSVALALLVATRVYRGHWVPLKRFSAFVLDFLYLPLKFLFAALKGVPKLDAVMVALKNRVNRRRFERARKRIILAPQCLRALDCPAVSTRRGIQCRRCGKCAVCEMAKEAERLGFPFYLLTGSSFVPTIIREVRPDAALLVACPYECNKVMMALGGLTTYAVELDRDGCVGTAVSVPAGLEAMRMGRADEEASDGAPDR